MADPRSYFGWRRTAEEVHVDPAEDGNAVSEGTFGFGDGQDGVLVRVLGVDLHVLDQVVQDRLDLATAVQQVELPGVVKHLRGGLVRGEHELAQVVRRDQRARAKAQVVAAPHHAHVLELHRDFV